MSESTVQLDGQRRVHFRDILRDARAGVLGDAEGFQRVLYSVERLGAFLAGGGIGWGGCKDRISALAASSPLAQEIPSEYRGIHTDFDTLYTIVRQARNSAVHEGAFARQLTMHACALALIMENALTATMTRIGDFAVHHVVLADAWQPISFIRQIMLSYSFSYLPIKLNEAAGMEWGLISDVSVARYLRSASSTTEYRRRLSCTIGEAIAAGDIRPATPYVCTPDTEIPDALAHCAGMPVLVRRQSGELIGMATPFDLL